MFNERAGGQPGPTSGYLNIYKNPGSTCWNKPSSTHQLLHRQVSKPIVPESRISASVPHARPSQARQQLYAEGKFAEKCKVDYRARTDEVYALLRR